MWYLGFLQLRLQLATTFLIISIIMAEIIGLLVMGQYYATATHRSTDFVWSQQEYYTYNYNITYVLQNYEKSFTGSETIYFGM